MIRFVRWAFSLDLMECGLARCKRSGRELKDFKILRFSLLWVDELGSLYFFLGDRLDCVRVKSVVCEV